MRFGWEECVPTVGRPIFSWADQRALGAKIRGGGNISPHGNIRGSFQMDASELSYSQRQRIISSSLLRLLPISRHWGVIGRLVDLILKSFIKYKFRAIGPLRGQLLIK